MGSYNKKVQCSQCNKFIGWGLTGYSHCSSHDISLARVRIDELERENTELLEMNRALNKAMKQHTSVLDEAREIVEAHTKNTTAERRDS
jgi:hypothetical protein